VKKTSLVIALSAILPGIAMAGAPGTDGFGAWNIDTSGTITLTGTGTGGGTSGCPTGMTCSGTPISDSGFLQVQMTDGTNTYFQTIIADAPATTGGTVPFSSENFVKSGATAGGIAAQQNMSITDTNGTVNASTTLAMGDFNNGTENQVDMSQKLGDTAGEFYAGFTYGKNSAGDASTMNLDQQLKTTAGDFATSFSATQDNTINTTTGAVSLAGQSIDIAMGIVLNPGGTLSDQSFSFSQLSGTALTSGGTIDVANPPGTGPDPSVTWVAGDKASKTVIGQSVTDAGVFGYGSIADATAGTKLADYSLSTNDGTTLYTLNTGTDPFAVNDPTGIVVSVP